MKRLTAFIFILSISLLASAQKTELLPSRFLDNRTRDSLWIASIPAESLLHSFRNTAGVFSGKEGGYKTVRKLGGWESLDCDLRGHITGHILSATASLGMKAKADSIVNGLAEVQERYGTGYLSAFGEGLIDRNIAGKSVWAPFYTLHKILQGLLDQYNLMGNEKALDVARGMGNWAHGKLIGLDEATRTRMLRNEFGGFNEAMYNLYLATGDPRHLEVARFFYHNDKIDPLKAGNPDLGTNHANTFIPKLLGECREYEISGSPESREAAELLFWTLVRDHAFVTGEVSDKEHLFTPGTDSRHLSGYDGENCCTFNLLKLAERLYSYEPRAEIMDFYERALYNHILGQQDPESGMVCYFTPLQSGAFRLYSTPFDSFWCCVGSGFESHARYEKAIYHTDGDDLYVNLFIPSRLSWNGRTVTMETSFPENGTVRLRIDGDRRFNLLIRVPAWASYLKVNGRKVKASAGYYTVRNPRKDMTIEFGMTIHQESTRDDSSRSALLWGPIVLAGKLETVDNPFSDPSKYNDYYTYNYGPSVTVPMETLSRVAPLEWKTSSGISVVPLYDAHHCRYVVYWHPAAAAVEPSVRFDYVTGERGHKAFLRLPPKEVKAVLYCHQNMTEEVLFRSSSFTHKMDSLGIAMAFIQQGSQNWEPGSGCQERFIQIMADFSSLSGHPEIATAPVIPFGHSAQATFPWNFAAWNPERTLCIISYHGDAPRTNLCGYGRANVEWGRTRNIDRIPGLMVMGEYEWWEARLLPALAFRMMYPESRISFLCDAGRGHFDLSEATQDYIARFIAKALEDSRPEGGVYYSRWNADGIESTDPHDMFWYQDQEMVSLTRARYAASRGGKEQFLGARINGELVPYDSSRHIKMNLNLKDYEFTVEPFFADSTRMAPSSEHASVRPRVVLISGPAVQTGEYSFRYDPSYFGEDPARLWTGITITLEAPRGDGYKEAVQEICLQLPRN